MILDPENNRLLLPSLLNARDLGGFVTFNGHKTAYRRFIRSDEPSLLSEQDLSALVKYPLSTVIDLRDISEIARRPTPFPTHPQISYHHIPLFGSDADNVESEAVQIAISNSLGALYVFVLQKRTECLLTFFHTVLNSTLGAILFHCTHGKDRTGIISALLLLVAGVSRDEILHNYAITYELIRPIVDPKIETMPAHMHHILRSDRKNMEMVLQFFDDHYEGSVEKYLIHIGLTHPEIQELRKRLYE
jgi:protein-tyrosine phosphatase